MPLNQVGFQSKLTKAIVNFEQEFERRPSAQELADILETDISKVQEALGTNGKKVSVDAPFQDDDSNSLIDIMTDESAPGTDNQMEKESLASDLEAALATLTDRERQVLKMLFGIGRNEMTAEEVANSLNLTRERVRQIKERALRRLREASNIKILMKYLAKSIPDTSVFSPTTHIAHIRCPESRRMCAMSFSIFMGRGLNVEHRYDAGREQ